MVGIAGEDEGGEDLGRSTVVVVCEDEGGGVGLALLGDEEAVDIGTKAMESVLEELVLVAKSSGDKDTVADKDSTLDSCNETGVRLGESVGL